MKYLLSFLLTLSFSSIIYAHDSNYNMSSYNNYYCYNQYDKQYDQLKNKHLSENIISQINFYTHITQIDTKAQNSTLSKMELSLLNHDNDSYHYWLNKYNEFVPILNEDYQKEDSLWFELNKLY